LRAASGRAAIAGNDHQRQQRDLDRARHRKRP
jgi:hypothetical protein